MSMKSTRRVLCHSLFHLLAHSHRSLIRLLSTACFTRAPRCAQRFAHSLTHSLTMGKRLLSMTMEWTLRFQTDSTHCAMIQRPLSLKSDKWIRNVTLNHYILNEYGMLNQNMTQIEERTISSFVWGCHFIDALENDIHEATRLTRSLRIILAISLNLI